MGEGLSRHVTRAAMRDEGPRGGSGQANFARVGEGTGALGYPTGRVKRLHRLVRAAGSVALNACAEKENGIPRRREQT